MQGVAVRIGVVTQHAFGAMVHHQRVVLSGGARVVGGDRRGIADVPHESLRHRGARFVGGRHGNEVLALHAGVGVIGCPVGKLPAERAGGRVEGQSAGYVVDRIRQHIAAVHVIEEAGQVVVDGIAVHVALVVQGNRGGRVVRAGDFNREGGGAGAAFAVRDGVGDRASRFLADGQALEGRTGVKAVGAVGVQGEGAAVGASHGRAHVGCLAVDLRDGQRVAIRIGVVGQHAVLGIHAEGGVFVGRAAVIDGGRRRVLDVPREVLRDRSAALVGGGDGDGVDALDTTLRGRVVQRAGDDAGRRINGQSGRQTGSRVGQHIASVDVRELLGDIDRGDGLAVIAGLVAQRHARGQDGGVVGAGHRHAQGRGAGAAFAVGDGVGDRAGRLLASGQVLEGRTRVEAVGAVSVQGEGAAVGAGYGRAHVGCLAVDLRDGQRVAVRIGVVRQHAVLGVNVQAGVFVRCAVVVRGGRSGIADVPCELLRGRGAGRIRRGHDYGVDAVGAALGSGMIDRAGDDAGVRIDGQARRQAGGAERQLVAGVGVRETIRHVVADFRLGVDAGLVGQRGGHGTIVGAGYRHDDGRRGGRPAGVRDGVRDGAGGRFADGQVVVLAARCEHIAAVGLDDEGAARGAQHADAARNHRAAID
ncbi:hypothetical protein LMG5911_05116 [Achromobacter spanius]|nr:hypothetical protein LMG5911_05116 [Achromobacter spanius]